MRIAPIVKGCVNYVFFKKNPIIQIVYLIITAGGFTIYVIYGFP